MYYSSGNYEAFATPKKPEGVDHKSAYLIGSGLAALTAACYLVRDGQMKGGHVHVFEKDPIPGGACDGYKYDVGYVMRGGREMDNHFEVMWDLLRSIPSLETEGASVLDEYYWLNKADPNYSLCRATVNRGEDAHTDGLPDFTALRFTRYNQYESIILPMVAYLKDHGVQFHYDTKVVDVQFSLEPGRKQAVGVTVDHKGEVTTIGLTENDLLFITNGGCVESCTVGAQNKAAGFDPAIRPGNGWDLWKKIAAQDPAFGHPEKFCSEPERSNWESATITTLDEKIPQYIQKICKRDPFSGRTVTGGIVTVKDSSWLLSWTLNRQQQFRDQPRNQLCVWVYGLFSDKPGDYVRKPMRDCTGREICMEWLYHLGVPVEDIASMAENSANTVPVMMPYIDAFFMPRAKGDRPDIVPEGAVNFAFLGQFAETARDTIFTTEYSMRTGMEAVYTLLDIDRGVPEVWGSTYDVRALLDAAVKLRDGRKLTDMELPLMGRIALKEALKKLEGTDLEKLLRRYNAI